MWYKYIYEHNGVERTYEDFEELCQYHRRVLFINNFEEIDTLMEDIIEVSILKPGFEVDGSLQQIIDLNGSKFELHVIFMIKKTSVHLNGMV